MTNYYGLLVPAKTPRDIVMKLHDAVVKTVATPAVRERLISVGADPLTMSPEEFTEFIRADIEKWAKLAKAAGIVIERRSQGPRACFKPAIEAARGLAHGALGRQRAGKTLPLAAQRRLEKREMNQVALRHAAAASIGRCADRGNRLDGAVVIAAAERHDGRDQRFRQCQFLVSAAGTEHRVALQPLRQSAGARMLLRRRERHDRMHEVEGAVAHGALAHPGDTLVGRAPHLEDMGDHVDRRRVVGDEFE